MKKFVLMLAATLTMGLAAHAQSAAQKFGYVNSQELLSVMPEITKAETDLKTYAKEYQDQLESMSKSFEAKLQDFQANGAKQSDAIKEVKQKELQDLQKRIEEYNQSSQEKINKKKEELYKPILERADKAIKEVAKEKNYDYVFDASGGSLLYAKDSDNIIGAVKAKLGIK